jgi:hypothetical protein
MAKCPTGFEKNLGLRRTCDRVGDIGAVISSVNFNDNETSWPWIAIGHGRYEAPVIIAKHPVLLPNRGLYFDGNDDFLRLYDIRFNFQFTIHAWVYVFSETGHLFSLETASPNNKNIFDQELAIKFGVENDNQKIFGVWDDETSTGACACSFLNKWKIVHFRFEDYNEAGATQMTLWGNNELLLNY